MPIWLLIAMWVASVQSHPVPVEFQHGLETWSVPSVSRSLGFTSVGAEWICDPREVDPRMDPENLKPNQVQRLKRIGQAILDHPGSKRYQFEMCYSLLIVTVDEYGTSFLDPETGP